MMRNATAADFDAILALNAESVHFLSPLDEQRLARLHAMAAYHKVVQIEQEVVAFLLAFREGADYDSPNYRWFGDHLPSFVYIDRIVLAPEARGRGLGAKLYGDVLEFARTEGVTQLVCEFDLEPPNAASQRFHERHGFREIGTQRLSAGKRVSLQAKDVL